MRRIKVARTTILFTAGLSGIAFETLAQDGERPTFLLLFAAMIGLPTALALDERRKDTPPPPVPAPPPAPAEPIPVPAQEGP